MKYIGNCAQMLEETSRTDDGMFGQCLNIVLYKTLADRLWTPFKVICFNPVVTLAVFLGVYLVFCIIYLPLWICSFLVTSYGSVVILLVLINYLVQVLARAIAFPGCNVAVQKQLSSEFISRIISYLENVATLTADLTATLMLVESGRLPSSDLQSADKRFEEIVRMAASLPKLQQSLQAAVAYLSKNRVTTTEEQVILTQLCGAVEAYNVALPPLVSAPQSFFRPGFAGRRAASGSGNTGSANSGAMVAAGHCLKASEVLKVAASAALPPRKTDEEGGGSIMTKVKGLLSFADGLACSEKLTFPYMRELLKSRFGAQRFFVKGSNGNVVDAILIPASRCRLALNVEVAADEPAEMSAKGIVLFCSPNAGFYECVSQSDLNASWLGFYTALDYDVCYYNYAGYGSSTGSPTPSQVKQDAVLVAKHLRAEKAPCKLIVHGESIGGLAACFVARSCPVDLLVCDRTFASLDSVATRLLGGAWAGYGLKYLGLWSTHVVGDFLACECSKLILQDPKDEIIANVASLKNGVATHLVLNDNTWYQHSEPQEYVLAHHLDRDDVALPHSDSAAELLRLLGDVSAPLTEAVVAHLFACIMVVARKSTGVFGSTGKDERGGRNGNNSATSGNKDGASSSSCGSPMDAAGDSSKSSAKNRLSHALSTTAHTIEMINAQGSINNHNSSVPSMQSATACEGEEGDLESCSPPLSSSGSSRSTSRRTYSTQQTAPVQFSSQREFLAYLCSISLLDEQSSVATSLTAYTKVWVSISRIDGGSGELLGQALRLGYDGFRAWLCALIVWSKPGRAAPDHSLPPRRASVHQSATELARLVDDLHRDDFLANNCGFSAVSFLKDAMALIAKRVDCQTVASLSSHGSTISGTASAIPLDSAGIAGQCCEAATGTVASVQTISGCQSQQQVSVNSQQHVGSVVSLHCGHNGWPARHELNAITAFFASLKLN